MQDDDVPPPPWPNTAADMVAIAYEAIERYERTEKSALNLMAALLITSHIADWYGKRDLAGDLDMNAFKQRHPEFKTIRDIANALKHPKMTVEDGFTAAKLEHGTVCSLELEWEDRDFWLGRTAVISHSGENRAVTALCRSFLKRFEAELAAVGGNGATEPDNA